MSCCAVEPPRSGIGPAAGVTLIETLFASTLGALLLIALLNLYQRGIARHAFTESRAELTETLFTAEHILAEQLHLAGGLPCGRSGTRFNLIRTGQTTPWLRLFAAPVQINDGAVSGSDELTALKTGAPVPLASHDPAQMQLTLTDAAAFERGDLIVACDADVSVLLQITRTSDGGRVLGYGHNARVRPGNCASPFAVGGCGPENHRFAGDALVAPYEPVVFLIKESGARRSLYRKRLVVVNAASATTAKLLSEELIEGIALLRVQAGVATAPGRIRLRRDPSGAEPTALLDIGFVALARGRNADTLPGEPPHLFGEPVGAALPADVAASNRRLTSHEFSVAW